MSVLPTGKLKTPASSTTVASIRLPHGVAPTTPEDGDEWTTTAGRFSRINGTTVDITHGVLTHARLPTGSGTWDIGGGNTLTFTRNMSIGGTLVVGGAVTFNGTSVKLSNASNGQFTLARAFTSAFDSAGWALGTLAFGGNDTDSGEQLFAAGLQALTSEAWTVSAHGTYLTIQTTNNGATAATEKGRFSSEGVFLLGTTTLTNAVAGDARLAGKLWIADGVSAPTAQAGFAAIYVDSADGDLKVRFGDGTTKTISTDT